MNAKTHKADYLLLSYFTILIIFGLVALMSASSVIGYDRFGDSYFFIKRQLFFGFLPGLIAFFILARLPYQYLKKASSIIFAAAMAMLVLVFIPPIGTSLNTGAQSWISLGGLSFQPVEFAKIALIIFLAAHLAKKGKQIENFQQGFLITLLIGSIPLLLVVAQPDIGTASILFSIFFGMLFIARARLFHLGALLGGGVVAFIILIARAPYRVARFTTFLHPELDPQGIGYHINQAFLAIGSGGIFGVGLGRSRQKFQYLPEVHADSIYAIIAEEMGFVVAVALIILLLLISYRCLSLAKKAPDDFSRFLVAGIVVWLLTQSFLNIGAMVGLLPITGVPLPFVSHGGTSLIVAMASVGILINISKHSRI